MAHIILKRTGANANGSVAGQLNIGIRTWPTIERGGGYTFVRMGEYTLKMDVKATGRRVNCLRFDHEGIRTHLIHEALFDSHSTLEGCIAPGTSRDEQGIKNSTQAMREIFAALGGFVVGTTKTIKVENNVMGSETAGAWMQRRKAARKY